jgi:hypothetical protein
MYVHVLSKHRLPMWLGMIRIIQTLFVLFIAHRVFIDQSVLNRDVRVGEHFGCNILIIFSIHQSIL